MLDPVWVRCSSAPRTRAMPKSATSVLPSLVSSRFSGLMSRWTTPCLMGVIQRQRRLAGDPKGLVHGELPLPPQPVPERLALDVRHGEPELPGGLP